MMSVRSQWSHKLTQYMVPFIKKMLKDKIIETENRLVVARTLEDRGCRSVDGIVLYLDCNNANVLVVAL